jgi:putative transport protein
MEQTAALLHKYPELALFLSIVLGHVIGRFHYKAFGLGPVVGTLIAGILIGMLAKPQLPDLLRWAFFYLFLFAIGYSIGPQFFGSLRKEALPQIALAVVVAVTGLATVIGVSVFFGFDEGTAVGMLSGGMTQSSALGTGLNAIADLPIPEEIKTRLSGSAPLADAITYGFGDLGLILFLTVFGPLIMRADLKREAQVLEQQFSGGTQSGSAILGARFGFRAYLIDNPIFAGTDVAALEERYADGRLAVQRVKRGETLLAVEPALRLKAGDLVVISAWRGALADFERNVGSEIEDPELLAVALKTATIVVTSREAHGKTLAELAADRDMARGVYLESLQRGEELLPRERWTVVERGDILRVVGAPADVDRAGRHLGFVERDLSKTDLGFIAGGICLGVLFGTLKLNIDNVPLGLGTAGSILVVGLAAGWARSRFPVFGSIPEPAQRLLSDIGLVVFIAIIGLNAGPRALDAYHEGGARYFGNIFLAGIVVTMVPLVVGLLVARYVLKMNPLMVMGGLAGAETCTPGLNALRQASGSNIGALAYTVPYAIGNILLTLWGPIVVAIMYAIRS